MSWWEYLVILLGGLVVLYVLYALCLAGFVYILTKWWY